MPDPHKDEKMAAAAIYKALAECSTEHPVFYEYEVDFHLNPKSVTRGEVGTERKYYLAGALQNGKR